MNFIFSFLVFFTCTGPVFLSCKSGQKTQSDEVDSILISLQKTGCLGECPVYELTIYENGKIAFHGKQHCLITGHRNGLLDSNELAMIKNSIKSDEFLALDTNYLTLIMDAPTHHIRHKYKQSMKTISCRGDQPTAFQVMEKMLEGLAVSRRWLTGPVLQAATERPELIVEVENEKIIDDLLEKYADNQLLLVKKITPQQNFFLLRISLEKIQHKAFMNQIRQEAGVKSAQWNRKLKRRSE